MSDQQPPTCVPINVELMGWSQFVCVPPEKDSSTRNGVTQIRCLLTPEKPEAQVVLRGGRRIVIRGWANQTSLSYVCRHGRQFHALQRGLEAWIDSYEDHERNPDGSRPEWLNPLLDSLIQVLTKAEATP